MSEINAAQGFNPFLYPNSINGASYKELSETDYYNNLYEAAEKNGIDVEQYSISDLELIPQLYMSNEEYSQILEYNEMFDSFYDVEEIPGTISVNGVQKIQTEQSDNTSNAANIGVQTLSESQITKSTFESIKSELLDEIERKTKELKEEKAGRGWATKLWNGAKELFGGGDSAKLDEIKALKAKVNSLDINSDNIAEVYASVTGKELNIEELNKISEAEQLTKQLTSEQKNAIIELLKEEAADISTDLSQAKKQNGWISKGWDSFKNWTGIGASSNKADIKAESLNDAIKSLEENPDDLAKVYKDITGKDLTAEELQKFATGESNLKADSKAGDAAEKYIEGQKMAVDTVADIVSGIAAVGVVAVGSAIGICAAPFTAGASLGLVATGIGMAAGTGAVVKTALKASDCIGNEKEYKLKDAGYDILTGSINGAAAPLTNALGGAAGTATMKALGMEALETTVKSAAITGAKEVLEEGAEAAVKAGGKQLLKRAAAEAVNMAVDGSLSGAADGFARALGEGRIDDIPQDALTGAIGGAIASPIIGGGFHLAGKVGSKIGSTEAAQAIGKSLKNVGGELGQNIADVLPEAVTRNLSNISDSLNERFIATTLKNCLKENADGTFDVLVGKYTVKLAAEEVTEEMLNDTSNRLVYEYAQNIAGKALNNAAADKAANEVADAQGGKIRSMLSGLKEKADDKVDAAKSAVKEKFFETKLGKRLKNDYDTALANFRNIPDAQSADIKIAQDFADYIGTLTNMVSDEADGGNIIKGLKSSILDIGSTTDDISKDLISVSDNITANIQQKSEIVRDLLKKVKNGEDVSEMIIELSQKGIDLTDIVDEKSINILSGVNDKINKTNQLAQDYNNRLLSLIDNVQSSDAISRGREILSQVPETNTFKQLGDLPERTKSAYDGIISDFDNVSKQSDVIKAKLKQGDIEEALSDLDAYYSEVEAFQSKINSVASDAQDTANRAGLINTYSTLHDRVTSKFSEEGFFDLSKTQQAQALIEESNIAFSKFIQTMSSDETLPGGVRSFFKEFTSNCTTSRTVEQAQVLADELYGAGKYTIQKSFGAGTIGETYLVTDANGNEFVMKMLKDGVTKEKFEADRSMFTKYIDEFVFDSADKEYKLKLINGLFDSWEKELDYGAEAQGAKDMLKGAKRYSVAQTLEVGSQNGKNISLIMEKADGVGLDTLIDLLKFKSEHPDDYLNIEIFSDEGKQLNPWIKNKSMLEQNSWIYDTESYREALPVAYQKAQNEQAMFLSETGTKTVHADPHGGNVFVGFDPETKTPLITYIDTGNVITRTNSEILSDITLSLNMLIGNSEGIATSLLDGATLPQGASREEMIKKVSQLLDERLYQAGVNLKDVNYTQSTMMGILKELNIIPGADNSNLLKANLQRIKTSREIFAVTGTEANKKVDIKDMLHGIAQSFKENPKETIKTIKPIMSWARRNKDQTLITFFQMMFKSSDLVA